MTREKRAKAWAAEVYRSSNFVFADKEGYDRFICDIERAYMQGAKDADAHPAWRKYEDEKPKEDGWYFVVVDGEVCTSYYCAASEWSKFKRGCVSHWLPFPKFNPKAEIV